ncbi:MAG: SDR family oxidoreductase [Archangium sp.]|nr:SDR family oxidoreductase [Archangium sp.]MDP3154132.1 SDR family oxidoreductase [Archangium sp.]MDP3569471.1 SDR family oxidoreductase [Archangium sp.]
MKRLTGKVALITGAAQGMGAAHARMFIAEDARVILTDVNETAGRALARELGPNAVFYKHDVTQSADWKAVLKEGEAKFGHVNVLVNNAGILGPNASTAELTEKDFVEVCTANQTSVFLAMQAVLPSMLVRKQGSIVNVSSIGGVVAISGAPSVAYIGSNFAVRGMTKQVAIEYGKKNIRVNSIHPGFIRTPTTEGPAGPTAVPLGRLAEPSEVSQLAVFLASDESSFITGMEHVIDGGMTAA